MSPCLHPLELMQIFPLISAGLGLTLSLRIAFQLCEMLLAWRPCISPFRIQSRQRRSRSLPGCSQPSPGALYPCTSPAIFRLPHPGPGEEKHCVFIPSAQKDVGLRRCGGSELSWTTSDFWKHLLPPRRPQRLTRDIISDMLPITGVSWWKRGQPRAGISRCSYVSWMKSLLWC